MELVRHAVAQWNDHYDPTLMVMANAVASYYS